MALIKCPECGREISDKAAACPGCGCPVEKKESGQPIVEAREEFVPEIEVQKKVDLNERYRKNEQFPKTTQAKTQKREQEKFECHKCGMMIPVGSHKCDYCGFSYPDENYMVGKDAYSGVFSNKYTYIEKEKKKPQKREQENYENMLRWTGAAIVAIIGLFLFSAEGSSAILSVVLFLACAFFISPLTTLVPVSMPTIAWVAIPFILFYMAVLATPAAENKRETATDEAIAETESFAVVEVEETADIEVNENISYENVFVLELKGNENLYQDKYVRTTVKVYSVYDEYFYTDNRVYKVYTKDTETLKEGDYITVIGRVSDDEILDVRIDDRADSKAEYLADLDEYNQIAAEKAVTDRDSFIESAISVTYDDLRRYPDTYKGKAIKAKIKIKEARADGWILQGDIFATMSGASNELSVYDARKVREPRFMDGDTITVYATADGLATIKVTQGSGIFKKTVDKYEVPSIKVLYTDSDDIEAIKKAAGVKEDDTSEVYEAGKKAGEAVNEFLESGSE